MKFLLELFVLILVQTNCLARAGGYDHDDEHEEYEIVCKTSNTGKSHSLGEKRGFEMSWHTAILAWLFIRLVPDVQKGCIDFPRLVTCMTT